MAVLHILCLASFVVAIKAQCIPSPCLQEAITTSAPVAGTTIIDNSISNALANALQLLIISNLIEITMKNSGSCGLDALHATLAPLCDSIPIPAIDIIIPDRVSDIPYNQVSSSDPVIDITYYPDGMPTADYSYGCESTFIPNYGCNIGCNCGYGIKGCNTPFTSGPLFDCSCKVDPNFNYGSNLNYNFGYNNFIPDLPIGSNTFIDCGNNFPPYYCCGSNMDYNFGHNSFLPNLPLASTPIFDCGYNYPPYGYDNNMDYNYGYNNFLTESPWPSNPFIVDCVCNLGNLGIISPNTPPPNGLPNIGCGCGYECDQCGTIVTEIIYPASFIVPGCSDYGYGLPSYPMEVIEPCGYDNFYDPYYGNGYFYQ